MAKTENLAKAKEAKNDEFYTQYADIQKEVNAYLDFNPDTFRGKTVLLPCDDPALPYVAPVRMHAYTIQQALAATDDQLRADPVFNHEPPEILSGNLQTGDIDVLLARGVPALSGPVGATLVGERFEGTESDLNVSSAMDNWPRKSESSWKGWRHSDIKDVALPFVFQTFQSLGL